MGYLFLFLLILVHGVREGFTWADSTERLTNVFITNRIGNGMAKIYIAKNRHGKTAQVMLKFFGEYQKFEGFSNKTEQIEKPKKELPF